MEWRCTRGGSLVLKIVKNQAQVRRPFDTTNNIGCHRHPAYTCNTILYTYKVARALQPLPILACTDLRSNVYQTPVQHLTPLITVSTHALTIQHCSATTHHQLPRFPS